VSHADPRHYEPTNITFGIMPAPEAQADGRRVAKAGSQGGHVRPGAGRAGRVARGPGGARVTAYVAAFADFLALNRNASSHTVEAYRADVEQYLDCVARLRGRTVAQLAPPDLDLTSVRAYLGELHKRGQARASAARKLSALRAFGRYLRREHVVDSEPAALAASPRRNRRCRRTSPSRRWSACWRCPMVRRRSGGATAPSSSCSTRLDCG
jgi:hypothetical protein